MEVALRQTAAGVCSKTFCSLLHVRYSFATTCDVCDVCDVCDCYNAHVWDPQRLEFLRSTLHDLERSKQLRRQQSVSRAKDLDELRGEHSALRMKLQNLEMKRELQEQLFDKFMASTQEQLQQLHSDIEAVECLAAASSSELVVRSMELVQPIKGSAAQSVAELIFEICAHYASFTQDSTRNV